jgi:hypothetical protein
MEATNKKTKESIRLYKKNYFLRDITKHFKVSVSKDTQFYDHRRIQ